MQRLARVESLGAPVEGERRQFVLWRIVCFLRCKGADRTGKIL